MSALPSIAEVNEPKKEKVLMIGDAKTAALPLVVALSLKAGLFAAPPKDEPLKEHQEDAVINAADVKRERRRARNLKNKANGGAQ